MRKNDNFVSNDDEFGELRELISEEFVFSEGNFRKLYEFSLEFKWSLFQGFIDHGPFSDDINMDDVLEVASFMDEKQYMDALNSFNKLDNNNKKFFVAMLSHLFEHEDDAEDEHNHIENIIPVPEDYFQQLVVESTDFHQIMGRLKQSLLILPSDDPRHIFVKDILDDIFVPNKKTSV